MTAAYQIFAVGRIRKKGPSVCIEIEDAYQEALLGLEQFSHMHVLYWFHENDTPLQRRILQVHPRGNPRNPLTGVFATHSPVRPNLIALTLCRILSVQENRIAIDGIDARDGTPVIDIKAYTGRNEAAPPIRVPEWARVENQAC